MKNEKYIEQMKTGVRAFLERAGHQHANVESLSEFELLKFVSIVNKVVFSENFATDSNLSNLKNEVRATCQAIMNFFGVLGYDAEGILTFDDTDVLELARLISQLNPTAITKI